MLAMGYFHGAIVPDIGDAHYYKDCPRLTGLGLEMRGCSPVVLSDDVKLDHDDGGEFILPVVGDVMRKVYVCMRCVRRSNGLSDTWEEEHEYVTGEAPR
jgi:hypothetical protein